MAEIESGWVVHKFGGSSVASAERYRGVAEIVRQEPGRAKAVVVSAMSGVTNALLGLIERAKRCDPGYLDDLSVLRLRHLTTVTELLPEAARGPISAALEADFGVLHEVLRGVWHVRTDSERIAELVAGYGELWSAQLLSAYLGAQGVACRWLDAREVLTVEPLPTGVEVAWDRSKAALEAWLTAHPTELLVITGFIASTPEGIPTTLKRNGSDHSASIFGALLDAAHITIWTDVEGVLSADPRLVPEAVPLEDLSYDEATELAYFGAKVVHPATMAPAIGRGIPIWIRNTLSYGRSTFPGTKIHARSMSERTVKGFSTVDRVALLNVEGTGMIGVPGVAQRLFGALRDVGVSVIMISQASSEHSICFAVHEAQAELAKATVERAFFAELHHGQIQSIAVTPGCSILAAVGDNMVQHKGVAGRLFSALAAAGVNIRAIAQGSSERNISAVIANADAVRALRAVHAAFYLTAHTLSIGLLGSGLIGSTLLAQLAEAAERLRAEHRIDLRVRAIADSRHMLLDAQAIDLGRWRAAFATESAPLDLEAFVAHVRAEHLPHAVIIDCTSSAAVTRHYADWLRRGIHVITPNKKANSGSLASYRELRAAARAESRHFLYETNVGAGLPVINTLRDLIHTGDRVLSVEGVLSGTLSYIFSEYTEGKAFSDVVRAAKERGFTEPDPRDDLSGMDVARKLVILGREMGLELELSDVSVKSLVPKELGASSINDYLRELPSQDAEMRRLFDGADERGEVLRYVGAISPEGKATVELRSYSKSHAFARIQGGDNIVAFRTKRYDAQPIIVQGPGAGPEVTAAGVFADLLRLATYLGAVI